MKIFFTFLLLCIPHLKCQRRITNGSIVGSNADTSFVVYMISAGKYSPEPVWPGWLCGGCIVHPSFILTSSACLLDVQNIYVISGYKKYIEPHRILNDPCIKHTKRKIVSHCTVFNPDAPSKLYDPKKKDDHTWTFNDLALAKVRPVFDFYDPVYLKYCSYMPSPVDFAYVLGIGELGSYAVVYGWGHAEYFRPTGDNNNYNEIYLQWAGCQIVNTSVCFDSYKDDQIVRDYIMRQSLCTDGKGIFGADGKFKVEAKPTQHGCEDTRRANVDNNSTVRNCTDEITLEESADFTKVKSNTRRNGICQNDHGSPLITWIGGKAYVIGTATAFMVRQDMKCVGPYVYTSVFASSRFMNCVLNQYKNGANRRSAIPSACDNDKRYQAMIANLTKDENNEDFGGDENLGNLSELSDLKELDDADPYDELDDLDDLENLE